MQHNSHQINIIPLGDDKNILLNQFKEGLMTVCGMPTWNGRERLSNVEFDGLQFCISIPSIGGIITAPLISSELKQQDRDNIFPVHWGNNFRLCILVCRFKDLLEIREIREDIAYYRYTMCNLQRSEDVFLLVTDVEQVVDLHNYSDYDIAQLSFHELLAEGSDSTSVITWKNGNDEKWKTISPQSFGQTICYYPWHRKQTAIYLDSLYAHWRLSAESGFVEIIWQVVNNLLRDYNIQLSEMSNNINYIIMCNRIKSWWNEKTMKRIHVAVVGVPSSGKTLLIGDMKQALSSMGYDILDPLISEHGSLMTFDYNRREKVTKDERYAMRSNNIYDAVLSYGDNKNKYVNFTIVNVPGESFDEDNLVKCSRIKRIISKLGKVFVIREIKTSTGYRKMVEYRKIEESEVEQDSVAPSKTFKEYNKWGQTLRCLEITIGNYKDKYEKAKTKKIDGKYLIDHYFEFDTDSVVNAIGDAWGLIEPNIVSSDLGLTMSVSEWSSTFSKHFSFHLYLNMATDVVFCEKLLNNEGKLAAVVNEGFQSVCHNINSFFRDKKDLNIYVAFRAIDIALVEKKFQDIVNKIEPQSTSELNNIILSNVVYSYFMYKLHGCKLNDDNEFKKKIIIKEEFKLPLELNALNNSSLLNNEEIVVRHSKEAIRALGPLLKTPTGRLIDTPHVYYTGTPITTDFKIFPNCSNEINTAEFKDNNGRFTLASSICFGSMQLCIDIMNHYGKYNHSNDKTYGAFLDTSFRK